MVTPVHGSSGAPPPVSSNTAAPQGAALQILLSAVQTAKTVAASFVGRGSNLNIQG